MFDRVRIPRTPKNARKLIYWGNVNYTTIPDDLQNLAMQDHVYHPDPQVQEAWQYLIDRDNRAVIMNDVDDMHRNKNLVFDHFTNQKLFPMVIIATEEFDEWLKIASNFATTHEKTMQIVTGKDNASSIDENLKTSVVENAENGHDIYVIDTVKDINIILDSIFPATSIKSLIYDVTEKHRDKGQSNRYTFGLRQRYESNDTLRALFLEIPNAVILASYEDIFSLHKGNNGKRINDVSLDTEGFAFINHLLYNEKILPKAFPIEHDSIKKQLSDSGYKLTDETFLAYFPLIGISTALLGDNHGSTANNVIPE